MGSGVGHTSANYAPPATPGGASTLGADSGPPPSVAGSRPPGSFELLYPATEVTVTEAEPRPIDLVRPLSEKVEGDVLVSPESGGDLYLHANDNVRTGTVTRSEATAAQCAAAIQDNPSGANVELHAGETYCLLADTPALTGQALVRLNVDPASDSGEVTLRMAAWDAAP